MKLTEDIKEYLDRSVLCWLATASKDGQPNVSPKEVFRLHKEDIIIANIASPQTVKNIRINQMDCLSFIDILVQKGYQIKGTADIIDESSEEFQAMFALLLELTLGKYPIKTITSIKVTSTKPILAPSYLLYPETTESLQIESAKRTYGL